MAENANPGTDPANTPDPTGATPPATDDKGAGNGNPETPPSGADDGKVVLSKEDYNNLISQRDKNFDAANKGNQDLESLQGEVAALSRERYLDKWLKDNKKDYPDVSVDDLEYATSPDDVEAIAKRVQGKAEAIRQDALKNVQTVGGPPQLTDDQRKERLAEAQKKGDIETFIELAPTR